MIMLDIFYDCQIFQEVTSGVLEKESYIVVLEVRYEMEYLRD